jgi:hypothetical protein
MLGAGTLAFCPFLLQTLLGTGAPLCVFEEVAAASGTVLELVGTEQAAIQHLDSGDL